MEQLHLTSQLGSFQNRDKFSNIYYKMFQSRLIVITTGEIFCFLGPRLQYVEVPELGVKSELWLLAYNTATATWDPSCICDLHHSSRHCQILTPLSDARDRIHVFTDTSQFRFHCANTGTPKSSSCQKERSQSHILLGVLFALVLCVCWKPLGPYVFWGQEGSDWGYMRAVWLKLKSITLLSTHPFKSMWSQMWKFFLIFHLMSIISPYIFYQNLALSCTIHSPRTDISLLS